MSVYQDELPKQLYAGYILGDITGRISSLVDLEI